MDQNQYTREREKRNAESKAQADAIRLASLAYALGSADPIRKPSYKSPRRPLWKTPPPINPEVDAYDSMPGNRFVGSSLRSGKSKPTNRNGKQIRALLKNKDGYHRYIKSDEWKRFRIGVIKVRGRECQQCKTKGGSIQVHHLNYVNLGRERPEDVIVLCKSCHMAIHGIKEF